MINRYESQRDSLTPARALFSGRLEPEVALDRVVILEVHVRQAVIGGVAPVLRCLAHVGGRSGDRGEDSLLERGRLIGGPHVGGHVGLGDRGRAGADSNRALAPLDGEGYGRPLHRDDLADEGREVRYGAAELAGEDVQQRLLLLVRGCVVHKHSHLPVALKDVTGDVGQEGQAKPRDVHTVYRAIIHVPRQDRIAGAVVRVLADPAGAQHVAVADLQQAPFQLIGHFSCSLLLAFPSGSSTTIYRTLAYAWLAATVCILAHNFVAHNFARFDKSRLCSLRVAPGVSCLYSPNCLEKLSDKSK